MLTAREVRKIEKEAKEADIKEIVCSLSFVLGFRMTSYLSGRKNSKVIGRWVSGQIKPAKVEELRLRYGYAAAVILEKSYDSETARAAFLGMNGSLNDKSPAYWLRHHKKENDLKEVLTAAKSFGEMGAA